MITHGSLIVANALLEMDISEKERFMLEALSEGRKARSKCGPNPPVGCVLVKNNEVIAKGHTNEPGQPHAEAMALQTINNGEGITAFVTLEPCSFQGRTPSCAKALISHGIKQVVVAMIDPHHKNNGAGIAMLQEAGVHVDVGVLAELAMDELGSHLESNF